MIGDYFSRAYTGDPFVLFSATHLSAIAAVVCSCLALAWSLRPPASLARREFFRHALAGFAILNLVAWYAWEWQAGLSSWSYSLPLQICTSASCLCPLMLWTRSYRLFEIVYFWGFAGATQALLTPDLAPYNFPHFVFVIFFTSHGVIFGCVVFMLVAEGYRPHWSSVARVAPITLGWLALAALANALTGGNYMYVARKPPYPTLIDALGPWPWYVLGMVAIGVVAFVVVYLPFAVYDWRRSAQAQRQPQA